MCCQNKIVITWVNRQITDGHSRKMVAFKLRPVFSSIDRNPKSKLRAEEEEIGFDQIFLDHMSVSTNAFRVLTGHERRPGFAVIGSFENVWRHVAKGMSIDRGISGASVEVAGLDPAHP